LIYAGVERFLVEFIRRNDDVFAGLTTPQLESLGMVLAGAAWIAIAARRGSLRAAAAPAG
jgi:phosphatidylglycerol:prolipoprotein diacylglycerol transferase